MIKKAVGQVLRQARSNSLRAGLVLASGLAGSLATGAPGDLDPTFGDAGRVTDIPDASLPAWSLELQDDGDGFLAGGGEYCYWGCYTTSFVHSFSTAGALDLEYDTAPSGTVVLDIASQPDGKLVGTGSTRDSNGVALVVFRKLADGSLDPEFGDAGRVQLLPQIESSQGASVLLEPDGRIVVAGTVADELLLVRLHGDGSFDDEFGGSGSGIVIGPGGTTESTATRLARGPAGGYRVAANFLEGRPDGAVSRCRILAYTAAGVLDSSFGEGGIAETGAAAGAPLSCRVLAVQPDGALLVGGQVNAHGALVRLLPDGTRDEAFPDNTAIGQMSTVTALALDPGDRLLVAGSDGTGDTGAVLTRLLANGETDIAYGDAGTSKFYVPSTWAQQAVINDMVAAADGSVTVAGGRYGTTFLLPAGAFLARLVGDGSAEAPGVLTVTHMEVRATESEGEAVVTVRRTGGGAGAVSVSYRTAIDDVSASEDATPEEDYTAVSGTLHWADGEIADRQVTIPIGTVEAAAEGLESFLFQLESIEGGAAPGGQATVVMIEADGSPAGQISIDQYSENLLEGEERIVMVHRNYYYSGEVSATITLGGNATARQDYEIEPSVVTWEDGDATSKPVTISALKDDVEEPAEQLVLTVTEPTGGAILGSVSSTSLSINDNRTTATPSSGGGSLGWLGLLVLGAAGLRRRIRG